MGNAAHKNRFAEQLREKRAMENGSPIIQPGKLNVVHEHRPGQNSTTIGIPLQQQDGSLKVITIGGQPVIPMTLQVASQVAGSCVPLLDGDASRVAAMALDISEEIISQYTERVIAFQKSQQEAQAAAEPSQQSPIITPPE